MGGTNKTAATGEALGSLVDEGFYTFPLTESIYHGTIQLHHGKTGTWHLFSTATSSFLRPTGCSGSAGGIAPSPTAPAGSKGVKGVDVVAKLEGLAAARKEKLNWKTSIVDLMKLLSLDNSLVARKELATELGCPAQKMGDSAQMNVWIHKAVLQKLADNGGNIPKELL